MNQPLNRVRPLSGRSAQASGLSTALDRCLRHVRRGRAVGVERVEPLEWRVIQWIVVNIVIWSYHICIKRPFEWTMSIYLYSWSYHS